VGKTSLLLKLGQEHFKTCVHIDLKRKAAEMEARMRLHEEGFKRGVPPEEMGPVWEAVLTDMDGSYKNTPETLVILDEIQESPYVHNAIRYFRRGLKSKLAVSGSYLGILYQSDEYWDATGDIINVELASLSFREFLQAVGIYEAFASIDTVDFAQMTEKEREICESLRELYRVYCAIGGYPEIIRTWIESKDIDLCKRFNGELLSKLYKENNRYLGETLGEFLWSSTLERITEDIVTKSGDLDKINAIKWLGDCGIISTVQVYDVINRVCTLGNKFQFYLTDMGILTQLCQTAVNVLPSDIAGMLAENFVFLKLRTMVGKEFAESGVRSFNGALGQIDFIMHNHNRKRFGIEVKHGSGRTKSGDKALAAGKIDYLIRIQDTYGSVSDKQATIPLFMLDKLNAIIDKG